MTVHKSLYDMCPVRGGTKTECSLYDATMLYMSDDVDTAIDVFRQWGPMVRIIQNELRDDQ